MIKCKQILGGGSTCGKEICCYECETRNGCKDACDSFNDDGESFMGCPDRVETGIVGMKQEAGKLIDTIANLTVQKKKIEEQEKKMREQLKEAMKRYGVKSFETDKVKFTYIAPTTRTSIDSTRLKKEMPDVAKQYSKTSPVSDSVKIEVK